MQKLIYVLGACALFLIGGGMTAPYTESTIWNTLNIIFLSLAIACVITVIGMLLTMLAKVKRAERKLIKGEYYKMMRDTYIGEVQCPKCKSWEVGIRHSDDVEICTKCGYILCSLP